jgi:hypothetical protein
LTPTVAPNIRQWHIYKITSPTGRVYIGKTSNIRERFKQHRAEDKHLPFLYDSIKKYGASAYDLNGNVINEFRTMKKAAEALDITADTLRSIMTGKTKRPNHANRCYTLKFKP